MLEVNFNQGTWLVKPTVLLNTPSNRRHVRCLVSRRGCGPDL